MSSHTINLAPLCTTGETEAQRKERTTVFPYPPRSHSKTVLGQNSGPRLAV